MLLSKASHPLLKKTASLRPSMRSQIVAGDENLSDPADFSGRIHDQSRIWDVAGSCLLVESDVFSS